MKVLFIERMIEFIDPMNIQLLSAFAKREGVGTFLTILAQDDLEEDLRRIKPDIVAISSKTGEHTEFLEAARRVKEYSQDIFVIMGGPHPTFDPTIVFNDCIDAIGVGDCDIAWPEFLRAFDKGGKEAIHNLQNIFTKKNFFLTKEEALIGIEPKELGCHLRDRTDILDHYPFYDREIVYQKSHLKRWPMVSFMASRGCPYRCTYCFEPVYNAIYRGKGKIYARYSVERLIAELKEVVERYDKQFIKFYDDMFFFTWGEWEEKFCELYEKEIGLPFFCLTRCDVVAKLGKSVLEKLKKAGLHSITMSIESGNEYIRNEIFNRNMSDEEIITTHRWCEELGIVTFSNTIIGVPLPKEVMEQHGKSAIDYDIEALDINIKSHVTYAGFPILHPYEMTQLSDYTIKIGAWDGNYDKLYSTYDNESPFMCFTKKEKLFQKNLALLGVVVNSFPKLRNITVKYLLNLPLTPLYFLAYFFVKGYLNVFKVYPVKMSFRGFLLEIFYAFKLEWQRRDPTKKRLYKKSRSFESIQEQVLGGASFAQSSVRNSSQEIRQQRRL